ncbi:glycosyltransferase [Nitrosovibrio sp. Nv6]|uniref:nucleotide disphospho-sugar-binding domain-containing protein n=1 Tax=Nitrosovibrio sp. Nv6 TaxID=1855340 RepID=UPI0008BBBF68|nr:glycosyltransferase [Nitrosovibrio sp. Nv6]SEP07426.1 UDP:flavonoid glycosyltransferase YjiC, YdhE family [Nitrosovibrio sp. Nv6]
MQTRNRPIILLVAEAVTLAHFARIATLARTLDPSSYEIIVASDPRFINLEAPLGDGFRPIRSISPVEFAETLARGKPLYNAETLTQYVEDDLKLLDSVKPDLVVGDFRLSLAVSAPLSKVPYVAVVNAYWSPFADISYPVPDLPMTRILGVHLAQKLFDIARPMVFALHARPLNQVRRRYGLPPLRADLRNAYTWGDYTLYADIPELVPTRSLPTRHHYLGPVLWSTHTLLPDWWDRLPEDKPLIFLTLGSSGRAELLPMVLTALARLPVTIMAATAGKIELGDMPANAYITDYLPMNIATRRSQLVISNGGSLTTYQAVASGAPVIGLCSNMDQLLNMNAMERLGAGLSLRAGEISSRELVAAVKVILGDPSYAQAAHRIGLLLKQYDAGQRFRKIVSDILAGENGPSSDPLRS